MSLEDTIACSQGDLAGRLGPKHLDSMESYNG